MTDDSVFRPLEETANPEDVDIAGWLRWWHWLILAGLLLMGFLYYPLWLFDHRWDQLQLGDSVDRMKKLLGDPGKPGYTMQGANLSGSSSDAYVYTRYWKTYEVLVSSDTKRVTGKTVIGGSSSSSTPIQSTPPGTKKR